jgi:FkbM family methyltransferase
MQLSYAQRLEDYHLALAFDGVERGFYVDIGGGHPIADNVSYWFYLKGWHGLVVEPQAQLLDLYSHIRPRDTAVGCLVGRADGEADFHVVERMHGLSTTLASHAQTAIELGGRVKTVRKPMRTLASLVAEHRIEAIDFLKIDVEGAEADVLAGMDWTKCRPKVVLVEAVVPGSMDQAWAAWEPGLLAHGYNFVLDDELNRFYVAEEACGIAERLPRQPAPWDSAQHLYDAGRAPERPDHPDHALANVLIRGFLAELPRLDPELVQSLIERGMPEDAATPDLSSHAHALMGTAEYPGAIEPPAVLLDRAAYLRQLMATDRFRAALGRIATAYDGGHIMD